MSAEKGVTGFPFPIKFRIKDDDVEGGQHEALPPARWGQEMLKRIRRRPEVLYRVPRRGP